MRKTLFKMVVLSAVLIPVTAFAADWPRFLGPNGDGISPETGINKDWARKPPKMLWKVRMSDGGYAGPSVADGKVFIIDHKGSNDIVRAINIKTGKDVWTSPYQDSPRENRGFARSTPTVAGGGLYTLSRLGVLNCFLLKNGTKVWSLDIKKEFRGRLPKWQMAMSPFVDGDKLILVPGGPNACVVALNRKTGKTIWKGGGSDTGGYATPVAATINGRKQYVVFTAWNLIGVDARTGSLLWKFPWKTRYDVNAAMPIVLDDTVFITSNYGRGGALLKISGKQARRVWENKTMQSHFSTPILLDGYLYGSTSSGQLVCMDWKTGATKWQTRGFEKGGVVGVDGALIAVDGRRGGITMCEMSPDRYKELGRLAGLGGQSWTAPIVADGKLIVRNKSSLACFDLK